MAINENDNGQSASAASFAPKGGKSGWSFADGSLFGSPLPRGLSNEKYKKLLMGLEDIFKRANEDVVIKALEMSRETHTALDFSCIVVCMQFKNSKLPAAFHILLLADTGDEIPVLTETVRDRQVQVHRQPSDAVNTILVNNAKQLCDKFFKVGNSIYADACVVQKRFGAGGDAQYESALYRLAQNAAQACVTEIHRNAPQRQSVNLSQLNREGQCCIDISFQKNQFEDAAGNLFRSDVTISFSDRKVNQDHKSRVMNTGDRNAKFSEVSSFMDVVWCPVMETNGFGALYNQGPMPTQKFVARQVITNIAANYAQTVDGILLAIASTLALRDPRNWIQAFSPSNSSRKAIDLSDVGALNIEGNIPVMQPNGMLGPDPSGFGKPVDTKADDFNNEQLGYFITALFQKECMFALDVPESGPQTHYLAVFADAGRGIGAASKAIYDAACELTNGEFQKSFNPTSPIIVSNPERIHAGTWTDSDGRIRDIRDFDHIAVANLVGKRNPSMIRDWSDTFLRTEYPEVERMDARRKMLVSLSNDTAVFTGFYQRVTFSGAFLKALDESIAKHNLNVSVRTPLSGADYYNRRGVPTYANMALLGAGPSFMSQGFHFANPAQQGYFQGQSFRSY